VSHVPLTFSLPFSLIFVAVVTLGQARAADDLTLGYTNLNGAKVPVPLGLDEGIFAKHNIRLRIIPVSPGTQGVPKLLAGEIDVFLGNSEPVVRAIATERQRLAVVASLGADQFFLYSHPSIRRIEELRGKRIGSSSAGASADRNTKMALKKLGLDPERDVLIVYTGHQNSFDRLRVLAQGEVDATVGGAEALLELGQAADKVHRLLDLSDIGIYVSGADVSVKRDSLERQRDIMQRFIRALEEGYRLAKSRPDLVRRTYQKYLKPESSAALDWMVKEYGEAKTSGRPLPDRRAIESHIAEIVLKQPNVLKDPTGYIDESLF
jgi:ABC-type nitrate/sulfonate/bicarbonate transport system substrate-binding protein